jgi:hypothetical protein
VTVPQPRDEGAVAGEQAETAVALDRRQRLRRVVRRGLRYSVTCVTRCRVAGRLVLTRKHARTLGLRRKAGHASVRTVRAGESRTVVVKVNRMVARKLRLAMRRAGVERVKATVVTRIKAGEEPERLKRRIVLRRSPAPWKARRFRKAEAPRPHANPYGARA